MASNPDADSAAPPIMPTTATKPTMAELKAKLDADELAHADGGEIDEPTGQLRARDRDDELLDQLPVTDHHLGSFAGWRATRKLRWIVGGTLGLAFVVGAGLFIQHSLELKHRRLHPLPEVEALIAPNTPREATYADGEFRVGLAREQPYINIVHLPDRDITLARGAEKAQFKVVIRGGKTLELVVLTGEIVETLTHADAEPLLPADE